MFIEGLKESHISDYKLQNKIGKGSFATVFKAIHIGTNRICAIKRIDKSCLIANSDNPQQYDAREVEIICREIRISKKADHPLIVHFYEAFEDADYLYIVMEYIEGESMLNYVNSNGKLTEDQARYFFKQLISCVEYLHNQLHVTHRDLKAENIIVDVHNNIRLIDFGLSTEFGGSDQKSNLMMNTVCGSPAYAAPELIQGNEYSNTVDIWSCGVVLYSMVFASLPFYDENITKLFQKVVFEDPPLPKTISPELANLISQLLKKNPSERISIEKIKESPWFNSSGKDSSLSIDFSFLLDSSLKINNSQLSHDTLFQLRRSGYQIIQDSDDNPSDPEKPSISEEGLRNDIVNSIYINQITTAYRIICTSKVNQNVIKKINTYKFSSFTPSQCNPLVFNSPIKAIGPTPNATGNRRVRRYSSVVQCNNKNAALLSPMIAPKSSNPNILKSNSNFDQSTSVNPNSNLNNNFDSKQNFVCNNISTSVNIKSNSSINSRAIPCLNVKSNSISDMNSNSNDSQNMIHGFNEESILRSPKESFPSNKQEVKFTQPQFFSPSAKSQNQKRHMSFSTRTPLGPSIVVPKVSFTPSNLA